ncbi:sterol desaturase family protein [Tahibacter amnicola]|uniref:Sterol desaturase family protein n=1 Tax=Tahibacter amnicola TaxID=2976241 RepID=A0ABY6BJ16_9GAMM|nr:sterol desaturase family protein [Tahibacter amnicola]UXI69869.1 sterol desaturase family protein [Tahibacter amnicola]
MTTTEAFDLAALALTGLFALLLPLELWRYHRQRRLDAGAWKELGASASAVIPSLLVAPLVVAFITALFTIAAALAPWRIPVNLPTCLLALVAVDFLYYWDHRVAHRVRLIWAAAHSVHHSSPLYNQTVGLRVSFVDGFTSPWFYVPAVLAGFDPVVVASAFGLMLGYQQWLHTEAIGRLPLLDGWLNTPSNHRVHHGVQPQYIDRNYGGIFMLWDRLFGTYAPEAEPVRYGLTEPIGSANPLTVHGAEAAKLWRDLRAVPGWRDRLALLVNPPGWRAGTSTSD